MDLWVFCLSLPARGEDDRPVRLDHTNSLLTGITSFLRQPSNQAKITNVDGKKEDT